MSLAQVTVLAAAVLRPIIGVRSLPSQTDRAVAATAPFFSRPTARASCLWQRNRFPQGRSLRSLPLLLLVTQPMQRFPLPRLPAR